MAIDLPESISRYFAADRERDAEAVVQCFAPNATVRDEGRTHVGRDAIRNWKQDTASAFSYTVEPFSMTREGDRIVVTSHLAGNFPGSPVDLRYLFAISGEQITALEITP
jgi:ketosteroid isomerase-like protein